MKRYSKKIPITDKVFSIEDIKRLFDLIDGDRTNNNTHNKVLKTELILDKSEILECINENFSFIKEILEIKPITSLKFDFSLYSTAKHIFTKRLKIHITTSDTLYWSNQIDIESTDKKWFLSVTKEIEDLLFSISPQKKIPIILIPYLFYPLRFFVGYTVLKYYGLLLKYAGVAVDKNSSWSLIINWFLNLPYGDYFLLITLSYIYGLIVLKLLGIDERIKRLTDMLWPKIEFNLGPMHTRKAVHHRELLFNLIGPFVLQIIFMIISFWLD